MAHFYLFFGYNFISNLDSRDISQESIDKIVVHHREEVMGETTQQIEIYYNMIGHIEIPKMTKRVQESCLKNFERKKEERIA